MKSDTDLMFDAACECLSPKQLYAFEKIGDADTFARLYRCVAKRAALSADGKAEPEHTAIYLSKRLVGHDGEASFIQAHISQAVSHAVEALSADGGEDKRDAKYWRVLLTNGWSLTSIECNDEPFRMWAIVGVAFSTGWYPTPHEAINAAIARNIAANQALKGERCCE